MRKLNLTPITFTVLILLIIALLIFAPLVTIWSLNTLFNLGIDYTFWTWLAMAWLTMVTFGSVTNAINKKD
jgi:hypothetical protein